MYRHVEFILGNKSEQMAAAHRNVPHIWPAIKENFETPSIYDEIIFYLNRHGYNIDESALERDWTQPYKSNQSVREAWLKVYENTSAKNIDYQLAEKLIQIDEAFSLYRWRHFVSVNKILGFKPGTGGSAGVGWLKHVTNHKFFPELWEIRNDF